MGVCGGDSEKGEVFADSEINWINNLMRNVYVKSCQYFVRREWMFFMASWRCASLYRCLKREVFYCVVMETALLCEYFAVVKTLITTL